MCVCVCVLQVTGVVGRADVLCCVAFLLSLLTHQRWVPLASAAPPYSGGLASSPRMSGPHLKLIPCIMAASIS